MRDEKAWDMARGGPLGGAIKMGTRRGRIVGKRRVRAKAGEVKKTVHSLCCPLVRASPL